MALIPVPLQGRCCFPGTRRRRDDGVGLERCAARNNPRHERGGGARAVKTCPISSCVRYRLESTFLKKRHTCVLEFWWRMLRPAERRSVQLASMSVWSSVACEKTCSVASMDQHCYVLYEDFLRGTCSGRERLPGSDLLLKEGRGCGRDWKFTHGIF